MNEIYGLAQYFVTVILEKEINIESRISYAIQAIMDLLEKGWTIETLKEELDQFKKTYPSLVDNVFHIGEIIGNKQPPNNLLDPDIFYYHNHLRVTSSPSKLVLNKKTRQYERIETPFFLEMKKVFTMDHLLKYWYEKNKIKYNEHHIKQDKGRFNYLLKYYDIDEVLFMIDISYEERNRKRQRPIRNIFQLEEYADEAREAIIKKRNIHQLQGINHITKGDIHVNSS